MAASLHFFAALAPSSISLRRSVGGALSPSTFCPTVSVKPLPKPVSLVSPSSPRFVGKVAVSSELDEDLEDQGDEPRFSPDLKLYVGNLPFNVDSATLAGLFEQAGNVEMVEVIYDKESGRSRGFGFVTMSTIREAETAAQQFNGYEYQGRALRVNAGPPPPRNNNEAPPRSSSSNKVHVGNLAWGVDDSALEALFSEQGDVKEATVVYDRESGRSRGFGFVTYGSREEVNNAIRSLDGTDLNGRPIRVSAAESRPRRDY